MATNKDSEKNFGYLGYDFQSKLVSQMVRDTKFGTKICRVLNPKYFDDSYLRLFAQLIQEYHSKYETVPSFPVLENLVKENTLVEVALKAANDTLAKVKELDSRDWEYVQKTASNFCLQQRVNAAIEKTKEIQKKGKFENYNEIQALFSEAFKYTDEADWEDVFAGIENVMDETMRDPIPTGIDGFDAVMKGGLGKGEVGLVIAPLGVGKSTMLTKIANAGYNAGKTVLQIFFEDTPLQIRKKHLCVWTGIPLEEMTKEMQSDPKVKEAIEKAKATGGKLILQKWPSMTKKMSDVRQLVRDLKAQGIIVDEVLLDYLECMVPSHSTDDIHADEGMMMREFESMCSEEHLAGWVATQGNRDSIKADIVTSDQVGGSIRKAQIAHIIISIAKSLQQREAKTATVAFLKSRVGGDGLVFENCVFDNGRMLISTESSQTMLGFEDGQKQRDRNLVLNAIKFATERGTDLPTTGSTKTEPPNN